MILDWKIVLLIILNVLDGLGCVQYDPLGALAIASNGTGNLFLFDIDSNLPELNEATKSTSDFILKTFFDNHEKDEVDSFIDDFTIKTINPSLNLFVGMKITACQWCKNNQNYIICGARDRNSLELFDLETTNGKPTQVYTILIIFRSFPLLSILIFLFVIYKF